MIPSLTLHVYMTMNTLQTKLMSTSVQYKWQPQTSATCYPYMPAPSKANPIGPTPATLQSLVAKCERSRCLTSICPFCPKISLDLPWLDILHHLLLCPSALLFKSNLAQGAVLFPTVVLTSLVITAALLPFFGRFTDPTLESGILLCALLSSLY
jgi:hypothetical protein